MELHNYKEKGRENELLMKYTTQLCTQNAFPSLILPIIHAYNFFWLVIDPLRYRFRNDEKLCNK